MPSYTLTYFNGQGRAELVRWLFAYGSVPYTDDRFEMAEWASRKQNTFGGRVPLLTVGDKPLPQSLAIARYAAREVGLIPKDSLDAAYCDAHVDTIEEIYSKFFPLLFDKGTPAEIAQKFKDLHTNTITTYLTRMNTRLSKREWFAGDQVSWADLAMANAINQWLAKMPYLLDGFPAVDAHVKKVMALPKIKEWLSKRPKTPF